VFVAGILQHGLQQACGEGNLDYLNSPKGVGKPEFLTEPDWFFSGKVFNMKSDFSVDSCFPLQRGCYTVSVTCG
jgi:hypothetical protein